MPSPRLVFALALLLPAAQAAAQSPALGSGGRSLQAVRTSAPPTIDGRLADSAWAAAPVAGSFVQNRPVPGAPASEATEVRVLYDDGALYVGVRARDARPDSVVGRLARRDQAVFSDWFAVLVDSRRDRRTALAFAVNPRGVKRDYVVVDGAGEDAGWDAVWEAATAVDAEGWTAEIRIPLSQLRFSAGGGERAWGINFAREVARRGELAYWSPVSPQVAGLAAQSGELAGLRGLRAPRRLEVQPYTVARVTRAPGDAADPFHRPTELLGSAGVDLRLGVGSDLTLTATLNPDFGQVEADPSQVNLTAFESFFQEKRPFFTEGAEMFGGGFPALFYSRRIGARPAGSVPREAAFADVPERTTILGAAKLTGRTAGGWSVGLMQAVTARESAPWAGAGPGGARGSETVEPATSYFVGRVGRDSRRGGTWLGGTLTAVNARPEDGVVPGGRVEQAYVAGVDGRHRFGGGDFQVKGAASGSYVAGGADALAAIQRSPVRFFQRPDAGHLRFDPALTSLAGYSASLGLAKVGGGGLRWEVSGIAVSPGFEANRLGFFPYADRVRESAAVEYRSFRPGRLFRGWQARLAQGAGWTFGGERTDAVLSGFARGELHSRWSGFAWYDRRLAGLAPSALRGGPALAYPASHAGGFGVQGDPRRPVGVGLDGAWSLQDGTGGRVLELSPSLSLRPSGRTELSLGPTVAWNRDPAQYVGAASAGGRAEYLVGAMEQTTASLTARLDHTFTPALSLQLYAQPFLSAGRFGELRAVADARSPDFSRRFRPLGAGDPAADGGPVRRVDLDGDGAAETALREPSFGVRQMSANAVLRWEYRPGSTVFVVWSQGRDGSDADGRLGLRRGAASLLDAPATSVLAVKVSWWLGI